MEILVHVSAHSTAQDDARYRDQVNAILACQSSQQWRTIEPAEPADSRNSLPQSTVVHPISNDPRQQDSPGPRSDHHPARPLSVQTLGAQSIATTIGSSPSAPSDRAHHPVSVQQDSLEFLVSVIPDSQPDVYPIQIPDPCLPHEEREDSPDYNSNPPSKRSRIEDPLPATSTLGDATTSIDIPANQPATKHLSHSPSHEDGNVSPNHSQTAHTFPSLPLEIHPPPPPISTTTFTTHITPTLSMLTMRLKPERTYKPLYQSRPLHELERGYWVTRITLWPDPEKDNNPSQDRNQDQDQNWNLSTFHRFWAFLSDFIGKDCRAGWGVWCILEHVEGISPSPGNPLQATVSRSIQVQLKVYAWGEIAMHVYLLLFLASERRVRGMGLQWRDSQEDIVIQMP